MALLNLNFNPFRPSAGGRKILELPFGNANQTVSYTCPSGKVATIIISLHGVVGTQNVGAGSRSYTFQEFINQDETLILSRAGSTLKYSLQSVDKFTSIAFSNSHAYCQIWEYDI